jgi:PTH1 family peptidyl-tRNA hydrolase
MRLIVGLGNPGPGHAGQRHNIGFMAVDRIAERHRFSPWKTSRFHGLMAEGNLGVHRVLLLKPETYMNDSGRSVGAAARFYKLEQPDVIVLHDELDLEPCRLRIKTGGGNGGHNGLRSIDAHIGQDYKRVRIGIGHPGNKDLVSDYVLSDFAKAEWPMVDQMVADMSRHMPLLLQGDEAGFMNKISLSIKDI